MAIPDAPEPRAYDYVIGLLLRTVQSGRRALRVNESRLLHLGVATAFLYRSLRRARRTLQAREAKLRAMWTTIGSLTRRVRKERLALQASDARYRGLFETVLEGVFQSDAEGRFLLVNPALIEMLGYESAGALVGTEVGRNRFVHPVDRDAYIARLREVGAARQVELQLHRRTGEVITVLESTRAIRDAHGVLLHYQGTIVDITERKHIEEQLRLSQKMDAFGHFAVGIAHDFNNLLTVIIGASALLRDRIADHPDIAADVDEIRQAGERAAALTSQLLASCRKQISAPQVLDLNAVVAPMAKMLRRIVGEDLSLEVVAGPALHMVMADQSQIEQVLMNLAINARDAMPQGGALRITTANSVLDADFTRRNLGSRAGSYVAVTVTDTGLGMTPEVLAHLFEPFYTTKPPGRGTGLGLATVYDIVTSSGGCLTVESRQGVGTTVTMYWPTTDALIAAAEPARREPDGYGTETILLAEDDSGIREIVPRMLERYGYTVLVPEVPADAAVIAARHPGAIHLLISDIVMPGVSGPVLAQRVVDLRPHIEVLFVSGYVPTATQYPGAMSTHTGFLQKPFTGRTIAQKVREALDRTPPIITTAAVS
jgi:two-component system cell cycle sensor histidine kinase/response regulator CckA